MSGLINFIKSLFSGIFGLFSKKKESSNTTSTPKVKKSSGYFLEAEETAGTSSQPAPAAAVAAAPQVTTTTEEKKPSKRAAQLAAAKAETVKASPANPAEPAKAPEPVAVAKALNLPQPTITTFAPSYLVPASTNGRRRPGANMASFLNMAKQVKVSNQA